MNWRRLKSTPWALPCCSAVLLFSLHRKARSIKGFDGTSEGKFAAPSREEHFLLATAKTCSCARFSMYGGRAWRVQDEETP